MTDLTVSVVNWNGKEETQECLRSLLNSSPKIGMEVIVVDNASTDGSGDLLRKEFPGILLIENTENKGYAFGNNQAFRKSQGRYFLILNSDITVKRGSLDEMVHYMEIHPEVGLLGGRLENPDGTFQPSANRRFPNLLDVFLEEIFFLTRMKYLLWKTPLGSKIASRKWNLHEPQSVAWVGGACMLVRRELFERVGLFDEHFFFYREDCDLSFRIQKQGWKVVYYPATRFTHDWGRASQKNSRRISFESRRSLLYYFWKHHGVMTFWTAKMFLIVGLLLRFFLLSIALLLKRTERARVRLFWDMILLFYRMKEPSLGFYV